MDVRAGPRVFVVRRNVPGGPAILQPAMPLRPQLPQPVFRHPAPVRQAVPPAPPLDILQEIMQQQQILRQQQEALQLHLPPEDPEAPVAPEAQVEVDADVQPLNALQAWQLNWQQAQQQQLRHMQPFLADPAPAVAPVARPARNPGPLPTPPGAIRLWEQELEADRSKRHDKYKRMSDSTASDKKAIQQQASAMMTSVASQERVILYLRSLDLPNDNDAVQDLPQTIDVLQSARQDLVDHFEFLGVAHDHGWDAARFYRDEPSDAVSKRVQSAVSRARKKKEADDRDKKKKKQKRSSSSHSSSSSFKRRSSESEKSCKCSAASSSSACCAPCYGSQPYQRQFRSNQNLPCIRCGDTAHHWRLSLIHI